MTIAGIPEVFHLHHDFQELALFLGPEFNLKWCDASDEKGHIEAQKYATNAEFMRDTLIFCYQNIGLMAEGIHRPYIAKLLDMAGDAPMPSVIDVGAGGGQLGLALHTLGWRVSFADIFGRSWTWLNWRLQHRRLFLPLYIWNAVDVVIPRHNFALCFDVMEHLTPDEQHKLLENLAIVGEIVMVNLVIETRDMAMHTKINAQAITDWIGERWNGWATPYYPDEHGEPRQWLLIYGDGVNTRTTQEHNAAV
jgi:hypothetical protein